MTLRKRLAFFFFIVIAVGAASSFVFIRISSENLFRSYVFSGDAAKAEEYAAALERYFLRTGSWDGVDQYVSGLASRFFVSPAGGTGEPSFADRVVLTDSAGIVVADSAGELTGSAHPRRHLSHGIPVLADAVMRGTVMVGSMIDSSMRGTAESFLLFLTLSLLTSTGLAALLAFLLGLVFASRLADPVERLNHAAGRIADGDYTVEVPEDGDDEFARLSASFNRMARELESLESAKRRVIADAAHELRTPTTLIRGTLEGILDGVFSMDKETLAPVLEETLRLSKLIDTLRELEFIESGRMKLEPTKIDLFEVAQRAVGLFGPVAAEKGISLRVVPRGNNPCEIWADPFRIDEVVYNLLSNAVKFAGTGGSIRIDVWLEKDAVLLSVDDTGPGVPPEERERIFDRFYRIDASRCSDSGGRGLGLAIVKEIVAAHDGTVSAGASDLGGASFVMTLPRFSKTPR